MFHIQLFIMGMFVAMACGIILWAAVQQANTQCAKHREHKR